MLSVFGLLCHSICGGKNEEIYKVFIWISIGDIFELFALKLCFCEGLLALFRKRRSRLS